MIDGIVATAVMLGGSIDDRGSATEVGPLDVELAVETDSASGCPLRGRDVETVRQSVTQPDRETDGTCQVAIDDAEHCGYERTSVGETCPCALLEEHDCIADLEAVRDGRLYFSLVLPGRAVLRSIVEDLRAAGVTVSVERIRTGAVDDDATGDTGLTQKQREALALAIESGYYERPREATLDDLADELGVTRSAVSQRLTAIERKLVWERARDEDLE